MQDKWWDISWNVVVGCKRGCTYCWARKMFNRFHPKENFEDIHYYPERLTIPLTIKRPKRIFVGDMCDLFADWTPKCYVEDILRIIKKCPQHTFMFLTKSPDGYNNFEYPKNVWLGATITGIKDIDIADKLARIQTHNLKFLSIEPLLDRINTPHFLYTDFDWIIIGGLTPKAVHKKEWVKEYLWFNSKRPVFLKDNLHYPKVLKEYPKPKGA
jgi:protein gp37